MKYKESFVGSKSDFADFVKKSIPELFNGKLAVEDQEVSIPKDADLDYQVKYDDAGALTIKVSWEKDEDEEEPEVTEEDL